MLVDVDREPWTPSYRPPFPKINAFQKNALHALSPDEPAYKDGDVDGDDSDDDEDDVHAEEQEHE